MFYGSQTGTAEDYATRLAKEGHQRYGLRSMTADMDEFDYDSLDEFPQDCVAFFVVATYGEGEPTDNATSFFEYIQDEDAIFGGKNADELPLSSLRYVTFGLGNKTYEKYNEMVKVCDRQLAKFGASRIGDCGMGDDGDGTMEEDFITWKDSMWSSLAEVLNLEEREATYEPTFEVHQDDTDSMTESSLVFLGEPSKKHLTKASKPYSANNPFFAPIANSRELFSVQGRNCMHIEISIEGSGMKYQTGDHIAIWPMNPDQEVNRLLRVLGFADKRDISFRLKAIDSTSKIPIPQPTTYASALRYYLEICGPVSRQLLSTLAQFAPSEQARSEVARLSQDRTAFHERVSKPHLNLGQMLESISPDIWNIPFSVFLESIGRLQPRFYSISSSNLVQPNLVSVTAVVESRTFIDHENVLNGVATNYLLALTLLKNGAKDPHPYGLSYNTDGPRSKYSFAKVPVHIRQSNFKLPQDPATPIVMVGPGTGVAPFRAFIQERAQQVRSGMTVGKMLLFFGCRNRKEDFLYQDEWSEYKRDLGDLLDVDVAFSREGTTKVYVQHRLAARAEEVKLLLTKGNFYLCGDAAHMARAVNEQLIALLGEGEVQKMRNAHRHQEDVWS